MKISLGNKEQVPEKFKKENPGNQEKIPQIFRKYLLAIKRKFGKTQRTKSWK